MIKIKREDVRQIAKDYASELRKSDIGLTDDYIDKLEKVVYDSLIKSYETPVQIFEII